MKRKIFRVSILFVLLFCLSTTAFAEDVEVGMEDDIGAATIMTTNIGKIVKKFSISNNKVAKITCQLSGNAGVRKTIIIATLQKKKGNLWENIKTWKKSSDSSRVSLSKTKVVSTGTYRTKIVFKAYKDGKVETKTTYTTEKYA